MERAATGIITLVNLNMAGGIRRVSVERGYDPRDFALIGAGGAAGMHVMRLAEEIGSNVVLIPKVASGLCAYGQILGHPLRPVDHPAPMRLDDDRVDLPLLNGTLRELRERGMDNLREDGFGAGNNVECQYHLEIRYLGQIHECSVELSCDQLDPGALAALRDAFHTRHKALFSPQRTAEPDRTGQPRMLGDCVRNARPCPSCRQPPTTPRPRPAATARCCSMTRRPAADAGVQR